MHVNGTHDLCGHSRKSIFSQFENPLASFRRNSPLTLALKNQFARGFRLFQEIRCGPCANSLQAYAEQCVQDVHGNLTVLPDGPLEGRVASSVSGIACIFNNQMWFVSQLLSRHGVNNLCRMRTESDLKFVLLLTKVRCHASEIMLIMWKATFY